MHPSSKIAYMMRVLYFIVPLFTYSLVYPNISIRRGGTRMKMRGANAMDGAAPGRGTPVLALHFPHLCLGEEPSLVPGPNCT